jgi:hypothetical protein
VDTCRGRPFGHPELMFPVREGGGSDDKSACP